MGKGEATYQFHPVGAVIFDELHDVPVWHSLQHNSELPFRRIFLNPRCLDVIAYSRDNFLAKPLEWSG